tara:strand:- start:135 stop:464 length:330 start_codon:yes stop_codon:yes gene_type:complete
MKRYCFDIDGTICTNTWGEYGDAEPFYDRIKEVNKLYDEENYIIYFTARGMGNCGGNASCAYGKWYTFTHNQLTEWGCKFNELILGKPHAEYYIDDKGWPDKVFFNDKR